MNLYGNTIWNSAVPNSEKAVMITEKEHLEAAVKALDETGANYCYYIKDNEVTIAYAKIAVQKTEIESLKKIPELNNIYVSEPKSNYVPKTSIIGNTAYKDIQNRHFQKLETDLALKIANELEKNGVHFSGKIYGKTTTITINNEDCQELERIIRDVVNIRSSFKNKIENINNINATVSVMHEEQQIMVKPLTDMCYMKGEVFSELLLSELQNLIGFTPEQTKNYAELFQQVYGDLEESEYIFADVEKLNSFKKNIEIENKLAEFTYMRGFSSEQKESFKKLIELETPESILRLIDYRFSVEQIESIPDIIKGNDGFNNLIKLIADIKEKDYTTINRQIRNNTYQADTAQLEYSSFDIDNYTVFTNDKGSLYNIPIETTKGLLNRLAEHGLVPKDEKTQVILDTDNGSWNKLTIPDKYGNKSNHIDISEVLTEDEIVIIRKAIDEVIQLEQEKETETVSNVVEDFRNRTTESFHLIGDKTEFDIELEVEERLKQAMTENNIAGKIKGVVLYGSRSRGLETAVDADIDIVVQIDGSELKEDALFNIFNELGIEIDGIPVDVNPIRPEETGTLEDYLPKAEAYLEQKQAERAAQIFSSSVGEQAQVGLEVPDDGTEQVQTINPDDIKIGDRFEYNGDEYTVRALQGDQPDTVKVSYIAKQSHNLTEYEVITNIDKYVLAEQGAYLGYDEYIIDDPAITIDKYNYTIDFNRIAEIRFTREVEEYLGGLDSDGHERKDNYGVSEEDTSFYLSDGYLMKYESDYGDFFPVTKESAAEDIEELIHKSLTTPDMSIRITDKDGNISYLDRESFTITDEAEMSLETPDENEALIEEAKKRISDFVAAEYDGDSANFSDLSNIGIAYTTTEDDEHVIQASVDLINTSIVKRIDGGVISLAKYQTLADLVDALNDLDFADLTYISDEQLQQINERENSDNDLKITSVAINVEPEQKIENEIINEKEEFFRDCDLPALLAKSSLAWDEIESLGFIFFDEGYIDRHKPNEKGHFGNGIVVDEAKAFELARQYHNGEDISKELAQGLFLYKDGGIPATRIPYEDSYVEDLTLDIRPTDTGFFVNYGAYSREVTFEEMAQAYLQYFRNEYQDIERAAAREETEIAARKALKESGYEFDINGDKFFFTETGVERMYYVLDGTESGHFVVSEVSYEDVLKADDDVKSINDRSENTKQFFTKLTKYSAQTTIDVSSQNFGEYVERFNRPHDASGVSWFTLLDLHGEARRRLENAPKITSENSQPDKSEGIFRIYQIKSGEEYHYKRFESMKGQPEPVNIKDYDLVYQGDLSDIEGSDRIEEKLEALFTKFNINHPDDFKGHSLSVSDVIGIEKNGKQTAYFCDSVGYKELPDFFRDIELQQSIEPAENVVEEPPHDIADPVKEKNREAIDKIRVGSQVTFKEGSFEVTKINEDFSIELANLDKSSIEVGMSFIGHWKERLLEQAGSEPLVVIQSEKTKHIGEQKKESITSRKSRTVSQNESQISFDVTSTIIPNHEPDISNSMTVNDISESEKPLTPKHENFRITDNEIGSGTPLQRFNNNLAAIRLLKELEANGRQATSKEQETLSRYVGWGGLAEFFKETNPHYQELKDLLTENEYSSARATTLDSFYTSPVIIDSIYTVLQNAGFEGGNILEPSLGIGNFFGRMPQEMQEHSKLFGVEIDSLTGRIAKQLYPETHIDIKGFEKTSFKNGSFDVAVGNIPFGDFSLQYDKQSLKIHDYFFMAALDKVKDGGIVAFITSKGTLDKHDNTFRKKLAEKADLIGAVRLPNTAFKTAGTEVTADIIFLQKRQTPSEKMPDWVNIGVNENGLPMNQYFIDNPEMVLGEIVQGNKMYGRNNDTMCVPFENSSLSELLQEAASNIQATFNAAEQSVIPMENSEVQIPDCIRNYSYFECKNNIYTIEDNEIVSLRDSWKRSYSSANIDRAKAYIQIRDTVRELLAVQQKTEPDVEEKIKNLQTKLNTQYDSFYKKYGLMHSRFNSQLFRDDSSYPLMLSLEDKVDKDKLIRKSDIFYKRTIKVPEVVDKVDTPQEALALSVATKGKIDFGYMSYLTDMPVNEIINELKGEIFPVPVFPAPENADLNDYTYQTKSEYLSGDIYEKLAAAEYAAETSDIFKENVSALKAAVPAPLTAGDIDIECGASWIPKEIYQQFMYETFKTADEHRADRPPRFIWQQHGRKNIEVDYSPYTNKWNISNKSVDRSVTTQKTYGAADRNAYTIFEYVLNLHIPNITKTVQDPDDPSKDKKVMDIEATKLIKQKAEKIKKEFKDWIFKDPERRKMLVDLYNRQFNCIRPREYDGSNLQFHGMNASIELHQHQKNAIAHAIYGGNTLFAHCVGAGKTFEMIATAMESKRLGLCSKSLFAVPNHLTEQVGADFMKLYPNANILVATKQDFTRKNRSKLLARIATGNYDAVIIGHSQLGMIPLSPERQERMYKEQIDDITKGIAELKAQNGEKFQVKAMERTRKSLQQKLEKLSSSKKDNTMYFEELGIDKLFVDEAHEFKNLMSVTKLQNVSGISGRTSQRATELFMKCRYLDEKTGGKGVVFATGTPVSNSITELHTMMRYLQYDFLSQHGMQNFDNWVSVFGKQKTDYELAPTGDKFKARTRIASYANMPELMTMFKQCADVRTSDTLKLPVPECELHIVNAEPTPLQQDMVSELSLRADKVQKGIVEPHVDNMLKITGDGRKVGLDPRLVNPALEDNPDTKLNQCIRNVFKIWQDTAADKMTQIVFCDLGVPKPNQTDNNIKDGEPEEKSMAEIDSLEESGTFCIYDDIKNKLSDMGIPKEEIAFIHSAKTETQKAELFDKVRSGEIRVLLGSTAKMGTGTNVQDRLIALHDLDVPWRPSDLEQRRGRMVRQGNINEKVHLYRYVTKGTFDAYSYQLLETKQRFISQVITSKTPARTCADVDQEALTYSEIKALCTGDERIKEKLTLENRVKELNLFQKEYRDTHYELEDKVAAYPNKRDNMCRMIEKLEHDFEKCKAIPLDEESKPVLDVTVNGKKYTDKKEAAEALDKALNVVYTDRSKSFDIGEIYGFKMCATYDNVSNCICGIIKGELEYSIGLSVMPSVNITKFEKMVMGIEKHLDNKRKELVQADIDIESAKEILAKPFEFSQELAEKTERLDVLTEELNAEAAKRLQNADKKPTTHYFGKDVILSAVKKENPQQKQERSQQQAQNNSQGVSVDD